MLNGFQALIMEIKEYESDTFSASGSKITHQEAEKVANELIANWKDKYLDGVQIDVFLDKVRGIE